MKAPIFATAGHPPKLQKVQAIAFYDASGRIHHMHYHLVLDGAKVRSDEELLEEARTQAAALDNDLRRLKVLHVREPFQFGVQHRVDTKKGVLAELPPPTRKESKPAPKRAVKPRRRGK